MSSSHADKSGPSTATGLLLDRESAIVHLLVDVDGELRHVNAGFRARMGEPSSTLWDHVPEVGREQLRDRLAAASDQPSDEFLVNLHDADGATMVTLRCTSCRDGDLIALLGTDPLDRTDRYHEELTRVNNELAVLARENRRKSRELEQLTAELQQAARDLDESYWHLRKVSEVLPICLHCGNVRTAATDWQPLAEYLREHAEFLSHGFCPSCANQIRDDLEEQQR